MPRQVLSAAASFAVLISLAAPAQARNPTAFDLTTSSNGNTLSVHQEIVGPDIVGPGQFIKVLNVIILQCDGQTFRLTYFASQAGTDGLSLEGSALAAALGLLQGMDPAQVAKIVGPDLEVHHASIPYPMEADEARLLADTFLAALNQFSTMTTALKDTRLAAFAAGAAALGVGTTSCNPTGISVP